jgi:hypothetical protein
LRSEELNNLYSPPIIIIISMIESRTRWAENIACTGTIRDLYTFSVRKYEGKRSLRRPRSRWEVSILMHPREIG